ncbi:hypothetical protein [Myxosarcina sp. GI1(2024)]
MFYTANATLTYTQKQSTLVEYDAITGEPVFNDVSTSESITASLEKDTVEPRVENIPGVDRTRHYFTGRLVSPSSLPNWFTPGTTVDIEFTNGQKGKFYIYPTAPSRLGLDSFFGISIEGVLLA